MGQYNLVRMVDRMVSLQLVYFFPQKIGYMESPPQPVRGCASVYNLIFFYF